MSKVAFAEREYRPEEEYWAELEEVVDKAMTALVERDLIGLRQAGARMQPLASETWQAQRRSTVK